MSGETTKEPKHAIDRESLGRLVRETWLKWLKTSPSISGWRPSSWAAEWDDLKEEDKEVDRLIGEAVRNRVLKAEASDAKGKAIAEIDSISYDLACVVVPQLINDEKSRRKIADNGTLRKLNGLQERLKRVRAALAASLGQASIEGAKA